jgi:hypothetical protein
MPDTTLTELDAIHREKGKAAAIDHLIAGLRRDRKYHQLFDALLMKKRLEMGLSLVRPTSLKDVPEAQRDAFEKFYIDSAREVGELLLADNQIAEAGRGHRGASRGKRRGASRRDRPVPRRGAGEGSEAVSCVARHVQHDHRTRSAVRPDDARSA